MSDLSTRARNTSNVLRLAHQRLSSVVRPGSLAVDGTAGNGYDTVHLARCAGAEGHVVAFDVQEEALRKTRRRLADAGFDDRVTLVHADHETMGDAVPAALTASGFGADALVSGVCFNLGYLPGGDKTLITRPETTLTALRAALDLLARGGLMTVVLYSGHAGGPEERRAVLSWAELLPDDAYIVVHYRFLNRPRSAELLVIERDADAASRCGAGARP